MTDEELSAIEKACAEATPGPWRAYRHPTRPEPSEYEKHQRWVVQGPPPAGLHVAVLDAGVTSANLRVGADAAFIAMAHQVVPALVAEVRRLRETATEALYGPDRITRLIATERAEEREACAEQLAKEARRLWSIPGSRVGAHNDLEIQAIAVALEKQAAAIRARSTAPKSE